MSTTPVKQRLHITFGKFGALKYTGNLDVAKVWERVLRRADLPIVYTQGFNTRPRIQLATALPLGITSECEIVDVALREEIDLDSVKERLEAVSPDGLRIYDIDTGDIHGAPLQTLVRSAEYRITFIDPVPRSELEAQVQRVLDAERIIKVRQRKRRKTSMDLRPLIHELYIDDSGDLIAHLATGERGNLRPEALIEELGLDGYHYHMHRFHLHLDQYYKKLKQSREARQTD
jgi:radical SAM-linked protein